MPEVIARTGRLAIVAAAFLGVGAGWPGNAAGQDYPSRAVGGYARPDQGGAPADDYGRYAPPSGGNAGSSSAPAGYAKPAAATQAWPEDSPRRATTSAGEAGSGSPPNPFPAGGSARALPLRFEPAAKTGRDASQASFAEPVADRPRVESQGPALALPAAGKGERTERQPHSMPSLATLLGSLAVVLGLFLLLAWLVRMSLPKGPVSLPRDAVEVLGRALLTGRQYVHLIRCGNKMLLVSVSPAGAETLTEITDPGEIDRLAGLCYATRPQSATANFRHLLQNFGTEPPPVGRRRGRREEDLDFTGLAAADQYVPSQGATHG